MTAAARLPIRRDIAPHEPEWVGARNGLCHVAEEPFDLVFLVPPMRATRPTVGPHVAARQGKLHASAAVVILRLGVSG